VKAASNRTKHGIDFREALAVFGDPLAATDYDRTVGGEDRWITVGSMTGVLLVVVHTSRSDMDDDGNPVEVIRMISARKALPRERRKYEEQAG
jgi:uncharacterized DUF497 family protein